ncbi:MAG: o-succinylbenzoate synthase [Muribaculaceae bacterium]|nr:o-succinylbenzoate synthase [Muribaculaceae bacterium]
MRFRFDARTSRGSMRVKDTYIVHISGSEGHGRGECALFRGLSAEDVPDYESVLADACRDPEAALRHPFSSIRFGFETAFADYFGGGRNVWTDTPWSRGLEGIAINGLIWMGDKPTMLRRIAEKLDAGFRVLKLKIGGIAFDDEVDLLRHIRSEYAPSDLEIRLDANGSFPVELALDRLNILSDYSIHSLEQPIAAGQARAMSRICALSPIPIALDEELIGMRTDVEMAALLDEIRPSYIILKPSLCGGFERSDSWIAHARERGIGWWATSALESDIGLNAIAQWVAAKKPSVPQGLGTGQLYENNIPNGLELRGNRLWRKV